MSHASLAHRGKARQYGLLAEEVAEIAPELVVNDAEGLPYSVRYHLLAPMLLNEMQKQQRTIDAQSDVIDELRDLKGEQRKLIAALQERVERLETKQASVEGELGG